MHCNGPLPQVPYTPVPDLGGESDPDTNPTQDNNIPLPISPEIAPVHPQAPVPNIPLTPPVNPAPLEPVDNPSPEQSLNVPIAICRTRREIRPPTEWWKVRQPTPVVGSESEDSDDDLDDFDEDNEEFTCFEWAIANAWHV